MTLLLRTCNKDTVVFWCQLYEEGDYKELASLALLLLSLSPTSVICKQGFSTMNYEFRSLLTQEKLNACMSLGMTLYTVHTFPFHTLKSRKLRSVTECSFYVTSLFNN